MIRNLLYLFYLLAFLFFFGCATAPYKLPPPQPTGTVPRPEIKRHIPGPGPAQLLHPSTVQPINPVAADISQQARRLQLNGQLDAAVQTLERGLRIAPKEASLWSQLAAVRLQQKRYDQARSLAAKSNSLAAGNTSLLRINYRIIEEAQRVGN